MRYHDEERERPNPPDWGGFDKLKPVVIPETPREGPSVFESFRVALAQRDMGAAIVILRTESEKELSSVLAQHMVEETQRKIARERSDKLKANPSYGADFDVIKAEQAEFNAIKSVEIAIAHRKFAAIVNKAHSRLDAIPDKTLQRCKDSFDELQKKWAQEDAVKESARIEKQTASLRQDAQIVLPSARKIFALALVAGLAFCGGIYGAVTNIMKDLNLNDAVREQSELKTKFNLLIGADPNRWGTPYDALAGGNCTIIADLKRSGADFAPALERQRLQKIAMPDCPALR